eukprot:TRINITY_DN1142_c0_g1_i1.p1 TRINITY_DN1142_c0_g1~~TRINITY_DN1142_c0_g1_i1.p1  ORF type:complete len:190 (-),score=37.10 TRINITY_DN1142_c0_g1_i1:210-779(-)
MSTDTYHNYKLCVLGDGAVGKTALTIQFCSSIFVENYDPTIEDSYKRQATIDDEPCIINVLDTSGQDEFQSLRSQWIRDSEAFLLIYTITQKNSFEQLPKFIDQIISAKCDNDSVLIIVGNKCDLENLREVSKEEGMNFARENASKYFETSAKNRVNVDEVFFAAVREMRRKNPRKKTEKPFFSFCQLL